jgi:peroxiredoxin
MGKPAPEIRGEDLDGVQFKLSDYRGKVVVLAFWTEKSTSLVRATSLAERLKDKRSVLIGVNCDEDKLAVRKRLADLNITWRSFWDEDGTIAEDWRVDRVPTVYVLDHNGVLRYEVNTNLELNGAIARLLAELERYERGGK